MNRKYLHRRATREPRGAVHHLALGAVVSIPDAVELPDAIYDQGIAASCWAFGYAKAAEAFQRVHAPPGGLITPVSARAAYALARSLMVSDPEVELTDTGTDPAIGVEALAEFGVMAEADCPYTDEPPDVNDRVELLDMERCANAKVDGFAWITDQGDALVQAIKQCVAGGLHVPFGMDVDEGYEQLRPGQVYTGPTGKMLGGHAQRISGYRPGAFKVTGSWGEVFADAGYAWISTSFVASGGIWNPCALKWAPIVREVAT